MRILTPSSNASTSFDCEQSLTKTTTCTLKPDLKGEAAKRALEALTLEQLESLLDVYGNTRQQEEHRRQIPLLILLRSLMVAQPMCLPSSPTQGRTPQAGKNFGQQL